MKPLADFLQILLSLPGWWNYVGCFIVVIFLAQGFKLTRKALSFLWASLRLARTWIISLRPAVVVFYALVALCLWPLSGRLSDSIQWFEQAWISPTFISPSDTSAWALQQYENQLDKNLSEAESEIVKRRTRETALKLGCSPLAIYEVAYSECGLNPFCVRSDGIAAGWNQLTVQGLQGIRIEGRAVTLEGVKQACRNRETGLIMDLAEQYFISRAQGRKVKDAADVYTLNFAPAFVGCEDSQVLYQGWNNPAYYLNKGLDGFHVKQTPDGRQKVFRSNGACDGRITILDLRLALSAKRANFLKQ